MPGITNRELTKWEEQELASLNEDVAASPQNVRLLYRRANWFLRHGQRQEAHCDLANAIAVCEQNPDDASRDWLHHLLLFRADLHVGKRELQLALSDYETAERYFPANPGVRHAKAVAFQKLAPRDPAALDACNKALEVLPLSIPLYRFRAELFANQGLKRLSIIEMNKALSLTTRLGTINRWLESGRISNREASERLFTRHLVGAPETSAALTCARRDELMRFAFTSAQEIERYMSEPSLDRIRQKRLDFVRSCDPDLLERVNRLAKIGWRKKATYQRRACPRPQILGWCIVNRTSSTSVTTNLERGQSFCHKKRTQFDVLDQYLVGCDDAYCVAMGIPYHGLWRVSAYVNDIEEAEALFSRRVAHVKQLTDKTVTGPPMLRLIWTRTHGSRRRLPTIHAINPKTGAPDCLKRSRRTPASYVYEDHLSEATVAQSVLFSGHFFYGYCTKCCPGVEYNVFERLGELEVPVLFFTDHVQKEFLVRLELMQQLCTVKEDGLPAIRETMSSMILDSVRFY